MPNQQLAEESHKQIIRKFEKRKLYSSFKGNIWSTDLADKQLISKYNKGFRFLLFTFQNFLDEFNHKANKIWVDKGSEFYNRSMKS